VLGTSRTVDPVWLDLKKKDAWKTSAGVKIGSNDRAEESPILAVLEKEKSLTEGKRVHTKLW